MTKNIKILAGVLIFQVGLFALLATRSEKSGVFEQKEPLLSTSMEKVTKISIEDADKKTLNLTKVDGVWQLPDRFQFPVSPDKIKDVLKNFSEIKRSWPVGKTMISAKQFEVSDDKFERRITFFEGDKKLQTLYIGSSPSFRKVHARIDAEELTYSVGFNTFDIPATPLDWLNKKIYELERSKLASVSLPLVSLKNEAGEFKLSDLKSNEDTDTAKTNALVASLLNPMFEDILSPTDNADLKGTPVLTYALTKDDQQAVEFAFFESKQSVAAVSKTDAKPEDKKDEKKDDLVLKVNNLPYLFKIKRSRIEEALKAERRHFIKEKSANAKEMGTSGIGETSQSDSIKK